MDFKKTKLFSFSDFGLEDEKNWTKSIKKGSFEVYIVQSGDTLWSISRKFKNVSSAQIKKWNNIWSVKSLKLGTKLKIYKS